MRHEHAFLRVVLGNYAGLLKDMGLRHERIRAELRRMVPELFVSKESAEAGISGP
jgi:DNA-binding transcriptional regulator PaaX